MAYNEEMNFWDHLEELRFTIIRVIVGILVGMLVCYFFGDEIIKFLIKPYVEHTGNKVVNLRPTEGFVTKLEVSAIAGFFLAFPYVLLEIWKFIAPGLYAEEKKMIFPVIFFATLLFFGGGAFGYFNLNFAFDFLTDFEINDYTQNSFSLNETVSFISRFLLAFAISFQEPIVIFILAKIGIATPEFLRQKRKYAFVIILIVAAIITPTTDPFTFLMMALPLQVLYEVSIFVAGRVNPKTKDESSE
ncbi:twin-arginine translocase subunit TatC [bacterium]|nr:twin-arginine translocase subunit TatC [bacterium]